MLISALNYRLVYQYYEFLAIRDSETTEKVDERARGQAQSVLDQRKARDREAREKAERQTACAGQAVPEAVCAKR